VNADRMLEWSLVAHPIGYRHRIEGDYGRA
jgi:hypothetical protein